MLHSGEGDCLLYFSIGAGRLAFGQLFKMDAFSFQYKTSQIGGINWI